MQARFLKLLFSLSLYCHTASREIYPNELPAQVLFRPEILYSQESRRCGCRTLRENQLLYGHLFQASADSLLHSSTLVPKQYQARPDIRRILPHVTRVRTRNTSHSMSCRTEATRPEVT